jgi:predicted phosphoribosyltransferase
VFPDLRGAGRELALSLEQFRASPDTIVLGIVLGGAPAAFEVACHLRLQNDFIIIRRLLTPAGPGSQVCAVNVAGSLVIDEQLTKRPPAPVSPLDHYVSEALERLAARERACRGARAAVDISQKTALVVDCGIRTGLTMSAAIGAVRRLRPARVVAAVPVASAEGRAAIEAMADEVVCLASPEPFVHVGLWYKDFGRPGDGLVCELLTNRGESPSTNKDI